MIITTLLLAGCSLFSTPAPDDEEGDDTAETGETGEDTEEEVEVLWAKYKVDTTASLQGVYSSGAGVYVAGSRGQAWVGSATSEWATVALPSDFGGVDVNGLWGKGSEATLELAIAGDDGWVGVYTAGSWLTWNVGVADNLAIHGTSTSNLYVVGENGILHFDGVSWTQQYVGTVDINAVWAYDGGAFAAGNEGLVLRTAGDGTWTPSDTGKFTNFYAVSGSGASNVWVVGDQGATVLWNGTNWASKETELTDTLNGIFVPSADAAVAVGNNGATIKWNGEAWNTLANETHQNLYAVHGVSGTNAWAVGNGGMAMQYKE